MAYFTIELYSAALRRDTTVTVISPTLESAKGQPCAPEMHFDGLWLLPRAGGLSTDWLRRTRHCSCDSNRFLVIMPEDGSGADYERFLSEELPGFLAGFGLTAGAEHNFIGAHPENMAAAAQLSARYPAVFGTLIPQPETGDGGWMQADASIAAFYTHELGVTLR